MYSTLPYFLYGNNIYIWLQDILIYIYIRIWKHFYMYISVHGNIIYIYLQDIYWITDIVNYLQDSRTWTVSGRLCDIFIRFTEIVNYLQDLRTWTVSGRLCDYRNSKLSARFAHMNGLWKILRYFELCFHMNISCY